MDRVAAERHAVAALAREALRRMVQPKNRAKGSWSHHTVRELVALIRVELDEVEAALDANEGEARITEELGDVAAFVAMALDANGAGCCCIGGEHVECCPGWFVSSESLYVERCDECAVFASDDEADSCALASGADFRRRQS